jgi:hypothetical protein
MQILSDAFFWLGFVSIAAFAAFLVGTGFAMFMHGVDNVGAWLARQMRR